MLWNTGIDTFVVIGRKIANKTNTRPKPAATVSIDLLDTLLPIEAPKKRPISIKNQYVPVTKPADVASKPAIDLSARNKFNVPGIPTSTPTYTKIPIAPNTK